MLPNASITERKSLNMEMIRRLCLTLSTPYLTKNKNHHYYFTDKIVKIREDLRVIQNELTGRIWESEPYNNKLSEFIPATND